MKLLGRLCCAVAGHRYTVVQHFTPHSRRVCCPRCGGDWAMNDDARSFVPWSKEFEDFYREHGHLLVETDDEVLRRARFNAGY